MQDWGFADDNSAANPDDSHIAGNNKQDVSTSQISSIRHHYEPPIQQQQVAYAPP